MDRHTKNRRRRPLKTTAFSRLAIAVIILGVLCAQGVAAQDPEEEGVKRVSAEGSITRAPVVAAAPPPEDTEKATATPTQYPTVTTVAEEQAAAPPPPENIKLLRNETIAFEDFENGNDHSWSNQRVSESPMFTQFLGRFGQEEDGSNAFTQSSKTYQVPVDAGHIGIEFDFYELDLWCDCDHLAVMICGETIE